MPGRGGDHFALKPPRIRTWMVGSVLENQDHKIQILVSVTSTPLARHCLRSRPTHHPFDRNRYALRCGITSDKRDYRNLDMSAFHPKVDIRSGTLAMAAKAQEQRSGLGVLSVSP